MGDVGTREGISRNSVDVIASSGGQLIPVTANTRDRKSRPANTRDGILIPVTGHWTGLDRLV